MNKSNKWLTLLIICIGGGIAYILPYIQYSYYDPLREGLNLTHSQMGDLMSVFGIASSICFLVGGVLADKFDVKILVSVSFVITGFMGFWFSTYPSYNELTFIMIMFSISTNVLYWPAMIKAVKIISSDGDYGKMFGFREAGFGLFALIFTQIGAWLVFNRTGGVEGVQHILVFFSIICIIIGLLSYIFLPSSKNHSEFNEEISDISFIDRIKFVIKIPAIWFIGMTIFCIYIVYSPGLGKMGHYFTAVLGFDDTTTASIMSIRMYLVQFIAAACGGLLADKMSSIVKFIIISGSCLTASLGLFLLVPATPEFIIISVIAVFLISTIIYTLTGTYMAPISEVNIPNEYIGTAIGIISFIGYLPEAFMWSVFGRMLGNKPGVEEFKMIYLTCMISAFFAVVFAFITYKLISKSKKVKQSQSLNEVNSLS
ncbi:MFS transporter [Aliivibrio fischeri]|uniref:MFS transporter n=1 Tax=Aliivibrio fischeri TaxID=668 RepID=UPI00084BEBE4|nr:MFS transporter [Aliivibrio fischeri]OED53749.1 hypothetical protein BEI47_17360 [Aliivibrio fischeri]